MVLRPAKKLCQAGRNFTPLELSFKIRLLILPSVLQILKSFQKGRGQTTTFHQNKDCDNLYLFSSETSSFRGRQQHSTKTRIATYTFLSSQFQNAGRVDNNIPPKQGLRHYTIIFKRTVAIVGRQQHSTKTRIATCSRQTFRHAVSF